MAGPIGVDTPARGGADDGSLGGEQVASYSERKSPMTSRSVKVGRSSRSLPLLSAAISGWSREVNMWLRTRAYRPRDCWRRVP